MALSGDVSPQGFNLADDRQFWAFVILSALSLTATLLIGLIQNRAVKDAKRAAEEAAIHIKPVGNGFANQVTSSLTRIEGDLSRLENKVDHHIQAHADKEIDSHVPFRN
jgi:hypothetical protein